MIEICGKGGQGGLKNKKYTHAELSCFQNAQVLIEFELRILVVLSRKINKTPNAECYLTEFDSIMM